MRRLVCLLLLTTLTPVVAAQQPRSPVRLRSFGQAEPDGRLYQSQVSTLAGQLALNLDAVRRVADARRLPPPYRPAVDQAVMAGHEFYQVTRQTADPARLARSHARVDAALEQLDAAARQANDPELTAAVGRARYADERLHAVLGGPTPPAGDAQRTTVARLARELGNQAEYLRAVGGSGPGFDREGEKAIRSLQRRSNDLARSVRDGARIDDARQEFANLGVDWQVAGGALVQAAGQNPAVRLQAARVDGLFRDLGRALGGVEAVPPVAPGNPPPGGIPLQPPPGPPAFGVVTRKSTVFVTGAGDGGAAHIRVFHDLKGSQSSDFFAYDPGFRGGVRVAVADLSGDGFPEIVTAPGKGMQPLVRVFDGRDLSLAAEFVAYDPPFDVGVYLAAADLTPDGKALVAVGPGEGGGPHVRVFDVARGQEEFGFFAYPQELRCGARVALGDVDGDGFPDLVTGPGPGNGPHVRVFDGRSRQVVSEFAAFDPGMQNGLFVATADIRKNGRAQVLVGTDEGGPAVVRGFDVVTRKVVGELAPYPEGFRGGVRVAAFDVNEDGVLDVVCAPGRGLAGVVRMYDGRTRQLLGEFAPYGPEFEGGVFAASR